jgi:hypothetical protein
MRRHGSHDSALHLGLASSLILATTLAACGSPAEGPGPQVPVGASSGGSPSAVDAGAVPRPTTPSGSATTGASTVPPTGTVAMKTPVGSAMAEDLKKLGLDPLHLQPLNKLSPDVVRKLMPTFSKALGVKCEACHDTNNFKAWTPKKKIAAGMWQKFVVELALEDGTPLYCDSCHGGHMAFLDTHDKKALSAWMDTNYVSKLKRTDKKEHSCDTCHGDPFEGKFLAQWSMK